MAERLAGLIQARATFKVLLPFLSTNALETMER
jgi:hypothetical protein